MSARPMIARGGAPLQLETVDGRHQLFFLVRHLLHQLGIARERHHPHADMLGQVLQETLDRLLRGHDAAGGHIFGQHAARHVHGQHQGEVIGRQRHPCAGTRGAQQRQHAGQHQQGGGNVPAPG